MTTLIDRALIVGGGFSGMSAAIQLRKLGIAVDLVENSARLGEIEIAGGDKDEHARIMRESFLALAQPI